MSSGRFRLVRDLGPVKGGKGLRHHEVVLELSRRGLVRFAGSKISRSNGATAEVSEAQPQTTWSSA